MPSNFDYVTTAVFKYLDIVALKDCGILHIFKQCSIILFEKYCMLYLPPTKNIHLIEFVCIRIIYLALHLDEVSSHKLLWNLPFGEVHKIIPQSWYNQTMLSYEINALMMCDYNPIRYCQPFLLDFEVSVILSPLYSSEKMITNDLK